MISRSLEQSYNEGWLGGGGWANFWKTIYIELLLLFFCIFPYDLKLFQFFNLSTTCISEAAGESTCHVGMPRGWVMSTPVKHFEVFVLKGNYSAHHELFAIGKVIWPFSALASYLLSLIYSNINKYLLNWGEYSDRQKMPGPRPCWSSVVGVSF